AKMAATLDVVSRGRLVLGLGAGPNERMARQAREAGVVPEPDAYGLRLPATASEASARLAETCAIVRGLWSGDAFDFEGAFNHLVAARCLPRPAQRPAPPILIGGWGASILRVAAEHADLWNVPGSPHLDVGRFRDLSAALDRHCAAAGRDPRAIVRSVQLIVAYDRAAEARDAAGELIEAGARHLVLGLPAPYPARAIDWVASEIIRPLLEKRGGVAPRA
ncbi:MAG TPA: LLM class flavin-dependent oxidoreductase, partial [Candidatus Dormibacteraeota bacterium]|nr:LLM class flavin-dependent oxidoreductase [Candidatus Dormibacteraeota bacterium]